MVGAAWECGELNITIGSRVDLRVGTGNGVSLISMNEGFDINIFTPFNTTSTPIINFTINTAIGPPP